MSDPAPPLGDPPPPEGPWLVIQILEPLEGSERRERRHLQVIAEALAAHDLVVSEMHPAVEDPSTVIVRCPDGDTESAARLRSIAALVSRRLELPSEQSVRAAAYPDLHAAHRAVGDSG